MKKIIFVLSVGLSLPVFAGTITRAELSEKMARVTCERTAECSKHAMPQAQCVTQMKQMWEMGFRGKPDVPNQFDGARVDTCIQWMKTAPCDDLSNQKKHPPACQEG